MNIRPLTSNDVALHGQATYAPLSRDEDGPTLDLGELLRLVRSHKLTILGTAAVVMAVTFLALSYITPLYSATAYVILDQRSNTVVDANAVVTNLPTDPVSIETQVQVLQSRNLAGRVVDTLKLKDDPEFNPPPDTDAPALPAWVNPLNWFKSDAPAAAADAPALSIRDVLINKVLGNLTVAALGRSAAISIKYQSAYPEKAALIANTLAEAYVQDQLALKSEATIRASQWLSERLQQLSGQTQASERAVEQYKAQSKLTDSADGGSIVQQQLSALNVQLVGAQADLAQQEAKYSQVMAMKDSGHAADVSQAVSSSLISQLRGQETELLRQEAELSSRYGPLHPKLLDLQSQKKNLEAKIDEEVRRVVATVKNDVEVARARVQSLQKSLTGLTGQLDTENLARVKLGELSASASSNREIYDAFLNRFKQIEGREEVQTPDSRVSSPATVPGAPSFPNKIVFLGAALPGGLLLGLFFAMMSRALDSGFWTREQVESQLALPVLAAVPEMSWLRRRSVSPTEKVIVKPRSSYAESMRGLQIGLNLRKGEKPPKIVIVTSSVPSEGKTTVAVSLARIAARSGQRVILVDADFRRPRVASATKGEPRKTGIFHVLTGRSPLEECLYKDSISGALILPAVGRVSNPSDLLASGRMTALVRDLSEISDLVIIDSPPVLPVNDTRILAPLADSVVFVLRWRRTPRDAAFQAIRSLSDVLAPVAGIVLARTNEDEYLSRSYGRQKYRDFKKYYND
jgi:capsular exopolysaccharide synthesis family protein